MGIGSAAAAWIGGGTLYGNGNLAATAGLSNNMIKLSILYGFEGKMLFRFIWATAYNGRRHLGNCTVVANNKQNTKTRENLWIMRLETHTWGLLKNYFVFGLCIVVVVLHTLTNTHFSTQNKSST